MATITLDLIPPEDTGVTALQIYESAAQVGPYTLKETTAAVGTYPNYITKYKTVVIDDPLDWFAISWTVDGVEGKLSQPIKGGSTTLVQKIINRVRDRDSSLNERVVAQEAEASIQMVFGDNVDPYDPELVATTSYRKVIGLVYLVLARAMVSRAISQSGGSVESATMGLVSFKSSTSSASIEKDVQRLLDAANKELGIATSFVMLMEDCEQATYITYDHSRLVSGWVSIDA